MQIESWHIYEIKNLVNGKTYVGQRKLPKNKTPETDCYLGSGHYLRHAIDKYGKANFQKAILVEEIPSKTDADRLEIQTIREYREQGKAEYNIADGGNGGNLGPEVNKRISEALQYCEKFKKAIDTKIRGRTVSAETRRKISDAKKGKQGHKWTEEQRQKFHDAMSGEKILCLENMPLTQPRQKLVLQ